MAGPGRAAARAAVAAFLAPPAVAMLNKIYTDFPKRDPRANYLYGQPPGTRSGAVAVIHILTQREIRRAFGGSTSGRKRQDFEVELEVALRSSQTSGEAAGADFDTVIDNIFAKLRTDHQLGTADTAGTQVWQAAENHIDADFDPPRLVSVGFEYSGRIRFDLTQYIVA